MRIRFYNARICTMEQGMDIIQGELWTEGNRIAYVGPKRADRPVFSREIDLDGNLILPGFKNAHTHSAMTFLRSYADDLPLLDWLEKQVFPMEAKLADEQVYHLSKLAIMEYLSSGITANFDMYSFPKALAQASVDCGFRTVVCGVLNNFTNTLENLEQEYLFFRDFHPLISPQLGFHAEYTCSPALLEGVSTLAHKYRIPVYTHNSESRAEVEQCLERTGTTPTQYLDSFGMFEFGGGGFHCVHMSGEDLSIFRKRGLWVVTNPGSNTKLASGIAPIKEMLDREIPIAIGTDGPASNNCLDFFREMFLTTGLQKLRENDASVVDGDTVLQMACVGGARAMGLTDCDCLAEGKLADLVVINLWQPNMQPLNNITKNIVYSGSKSNVQMTVVDGKILYENGIFHIEAEPREVYAQANKIIQSMI